MKIRQRINFTASMFGFGNDLAVRYARNEQRHVCRSSCFVSHY